MFNLNIKKGNKMKKVYVFISLALLFFISCSPDFVREVVDSILDNEGVLLILFDADEVENRTIVPDFDMTIATYDIRGSGPASDSFEELNWPSSSSLVVHSLIPGDWTVEVDAKNADGIIIGDGSTDVIVAAGTVTPATIIISPLEGDGLLTVNIEWDPEDFDDPTVTGEVDGYPFDGTNITSLDPFTVGSSSATSTTTLPAGYYRLSITVTDGETSAYLTDTVVRIIYDQETIADLAVTDPGDETGIHIIIIDDMQYPINIIFHGYQSQLYKGTSMTIDASTDPSPVDTYQWYLDGIVISGATGPSVTIDSDDLSIKDNYKLTLIVSKGVILSSEALYFDVIEGEAIPVYLEDAQNISDFNTKGTYGVGMTLVRSDGAYLVEGTGNDYKFGERLDIDPYNIYDTNDNGPYDVGKYFRLVHDGDNISDTLGLIPVAADLSQIIAPKGIYDSGYLNTVYIDPELGKFVFPRPVIWSKMENTTDSWTSSEIMDMDMDMELDQVGGTVEIVPGIFDNAIKYTPDQNADHLGFKTNVYKDFRQGTQEFWFKMHAGGWNVFRLTTMGVGQVDQLTFSIAANEPSKSIFKIRIDGTGADECDLPNDSWYHVYSVWDSDKNLEGGKSVRVFVNGIEVLSTTDDLPTALASYHARLVMRQYVSTSDGEYGIIDNFKLWNHVVSEDPSWCYNGGAGREDAIHEIYGSGNGYKPSSDLDVGYYKKN